MENRYIEIGTTKDQLTTWREFTIYHYLRFMEVTANLDCYYCDSFETYKKYVHLQYADMCESKTIATFRCEETGWKSIFEGMLEIVHKATAEENWAKFSEMCYGAVNYVMDRMAISGIPSEVSMEYSNGVEMEV